MVHAKRREVCGGVKSDRNAEGRTQNELQTDFIQYRYGTGYSDGSENADTAGDKAAAHKTKMAQYRLARLG